MTWLYGVRDALCKSPPPLGTQHPHTSGLRPRPHRPGALGFVSLSCLAVLCGLALSARHLARDLAQMTWQIVEKSNSFAVEADLDSGIGSQLRASAEAAGRTPEEQACHLIELGLMVEAANESQEAAADASDEREKMAGRSTAVVLLAEQAYRLVEFGNAAETYRRRSLPVRSSRLR